MVTNPQKFKCNQPGCNGTLVEVGRHSSGYKVAVCDKCDHLEIYRSMDAGKAKLTNLPPETIVGEILEVDGNKVVHTVKYLLSK